MGDHRAVAGILDVRIRHVPGVHVVTAAIVVGLFGAHRPHDREILHLFGHHWEMLADLEAGQRRGDRLEFASRRSAGLEVPHVDRGGSASHPEHDARLVAAAQIGRVGKERVGERHRRNHHRRSAGHVRHKVTAGHPLRNS